MSELTPEEICEQAGRCDFGNRDHKRYQLQMLCAIRGAIATTGGGLTKDYAISDVGDGLDMTILDNSIETDVSSSKSSAIQFYGTFTGVITFEASLGIGGDGDDHWFPLLSQDQTNNPAWDTSAAGVYFFNVSIIDKLRMRVTTPGTGKADYIWAVSTV